MPSIHTLRARGAILETIERTGMSLLTCASHWDGQAGVPAARGRSSRGHGLAYGVISTVVQVLDAIASLVDTSGLPPYQI